MEPTALSESTIQTLLILSLITLPLKAYALWKSAQSDQKWWFIAMLLFNSIGLLELTYLFYFAKKKPKLNNPDK